MASTFRLFIGRSGNVHIIKGHMHTFFFENRWWWTEMNNIKAFLPNFTRNHLTESSLKLSRNHCWSRWLHTCACKFGGGSVAQNGSMNSYTRHSHFYWIWAKGMRLAVHWAEQICGYRWMITISFVSCHTIAYISEPPDTPTSQPTITRCTPWPLKKSSAEAETIPNELDKTFLWSNMPLPLQLNHSISARTLHAPIAKTCSAVGSPSCGSGSNPELGGILKPGPRDAINEHAGVSFVSAT